MKNRLEFLVIAGLCCLLFAKCADDDSSACDETTWYEDSDGDGLGNPDVSIDACDQPEGYVADNSDTDDTGGEVASGTTAATPSAAFDEFDESSVTITFSGDQVTIEATGVPNHTSPYWNTSNDLYIDPVIADESQMSPGTIESRSYSMTVSAAPELAASSSATGLGAIGIAVTGVPIFNDEEGPNVSLSAQVASGFDYAGGHMGPTGYHYHLESKDVEENVSLSVDDDALIGMIEDGFLLYGRKCNSTGTYPTDLDESGGHTHATQHCEDGEEIYHYHIINEIYESSYYLLFSEDFQGTPNGVDG